MNLIGKIFEIAYLVIAVVFGYEAFSSWATDQQRAIIFIILMVMAIFMFFFRRKTRIKREEYFNDNK